jgi:class 3 adenylate cyclase
MSDLHEHQHMNVEDHVDEDDDDDENDDNDGDIDHNLPPPPSLVLGGRSISTSIRLQQQGFRSSYHNTNSIISPTTTTAAAASIAPISSHVQTDFAMKSIRRGSMEWNVILRPFVANIVFESFVQRRYHYHHTKNNNIHQQQEGSSHDIDTAYEIQQQQRFRPYTCYAAVLFVDLCNYSKITTTIAHRGAHVLSSIVNDYLHRILTIVKQYGGDVIKFAGDAIIVIWYSTQEVQLPMNVLIAAQCVLDMQQKAGNHPVDGTPLFFKIHCGLSCGLLESEIFAAPNHVHMQRLFHSVGGSALYELSDLVDIAQPGEVCISNAVSDHLGDSGKWIERSDEYGVQYLILTELLYGKDVAKSMKVRISRSRNMQQEKRVKSFEEQFIHPNVIKLLSHGGLSPTQISQMRNLCVLFIAMTSNFGSTVNWLMEVQTILDKNRCPSKFKFSIRWP